MGGCISCNKLARCPGQRTGSRLIRNCALHCSGASTRARMDSTTQGHFQEPRSKCTRMILGNGQSDPENGKVRCKCPGPSGRSAEGLSRPSRSPRATVTQVPTGGVPCLPGSSSS